MGLTKTFKDMKVLSYEGKVKEIGRLRVTPPIHSCGMAASMKWEEILLSMIQGRPKISCWMAENVFNKMPRMLLKEKEFFPMRLLFSPKVLSSSSAGLDECKQERMGFERMVFPLDKTHCCKLQKQHPLLSIKQHKQHSEHFHIQFSHLGFNTSYLQLKWQILLFLQRFLLVPFNNSYSSTPHSQAPFHCSSDKQQDVKGAGDAEIWPWLQRLLTLEGNNFITTWSLIACLGNIQLRNVWQQEREKLWLQYFFVHSSRNFCSSF